MSRKAVKLLTPLYLFLWPHAGECGHGVKCQHAHSSDELRVNVLVDSNALDEEYHNEFCATFLEHGSCPLGRNLRCIFALACHPLSFCGLNCQFVAVAEYTWMLLMAKNNV